MYDRSGGAGDICYAASTSSATSGGVGANGARRMRLVKLSRPRRAPRAYGFAVRGGREHAAGFFVSNVEPESEAFHGGLKIGDQVITVNGFRVDDAVHSELSHYIAGQNRLKMKVRNVGMVPVKDKCNDSLTWRLVCNDGGASSTSTSSTSCSPPSTRPTRPTRPLRTHLTLQVPAHAKLGCGICKGPDWKPGIYVQFVKEHGIAKEAGLRPGDQILSCNGIDFREIQFSDAISVMKKSPRLELTLCPGGGLDLVSPESSGYNSSASSATGDRSPPAGDHNKRLSIVTEETSDLGDRLIHLENNRLKRHWENMDYQWKTGTLTNRDPPSDIEPDYDTASISPEINHGYSHSSSGFITNPQNKTVINLTENGATIECRYNNDKKTYTIDGNAKIYNGSNQHLSVEKKTVVVEVHHNNKQMLSKSNHCMPRSMNGESIDSGNTDASSISSSTTLSSAITEELQRRKQKKSSQEPQGLPERPLECPAPKRVPCRPEDSQKKKQHDALMDEFKKVHRRMFQHDHTQEDSSQLDRQLSNKSLTRAEHPERPASETSNKEDVPPPPPPMPLNGTIKKEVNGATTTISSKQSTPTPDYEVRSVEALAAKINLRTHSKDEIAEMESIESYTMKNPTSPKPRPPSTYFVRPPNGATTLKKPRPVSVTIGEYPSNVIRKEPAKLEFLSDASTPADETDSSLPIAGRLQSELVMTLSRSNLRKRMEAQAKNMNNNVITKCKTVDSDTISNDSDVSENQNFHKRYGNNILPVAPSISIPKVPIVKCTSNGVDKNSAFNLAREALGNKLPLGKTGSLPLSGRGIIKDRLAGANGNTLSYENHKKISFDHSNIIMAVGDKK